jgi:PAS domain S-box-containing protein
MTKLQARREIIQILLVEHDEEQIKSIWNLLQVKGEFKYQIEVAMHFTDALSRLNGHEFDVVLLDLQLVTHEAEIDAVDAIVKAAPQTAVIVLTEFQREVVGIQAVERGAQDYLLREEVGTRAFVRALDYAVERRRVAKALQNREEQQAFLLKLSDRLRTLDDPMEILYQAACVLGEALGANRIGYAEAQDDGETIIVTRNYTNGVPGIEGIYYSQTPLAMFEARHISVQSDIANDPTLSENQKAAHKALQLGAVVNVPLVKAGRLVAVLFAHFREAHYWSADELTLLEETAERTWAAVERTRAEQALRESEAKYRTMFNSIDVGFCICEMLVDDDGKPYDYRWLEVNAMFEPHTGLKDVVGKTALELLPNLEQHWVDIYGKVALTGEPVRFTQGSDVMGRWFDVYSFRVGQPEKHQFAILFNDVTQRRRAEEQLRESEARFRNMADHAPVMIWITAPSGLCTYLNQSWYRFTGQTVEEALGLGWLNATHPEDRHHSEEIFLRANEKREAFRIEYRLRHKDGHYHWVLDSAHPRFSLNGEFLGYIGSVIDITERKGVEEIVRQQGAILEQIINNIPVMITIYEPDSRFLYINNEFERLVRWTKDDLRHVDLMEQIYPDPAQFAQAQAFMQNPEPGWRDFHMTAKDGSIVESSWANIVLSDGRHVGIGIDVREQKQNEVRGLQLLNLTTALSRAVTLDEVLQSIAEHAFAALGAERGGIALLATDGLTVNLRGYHYPQFPGDMQDQLQTFPLNIPTPMTDAIRTGQPIWIENLNQYRDLYPNIVQAIQQLTLSHALICLPMNNKGQIVGGIGVSFKQARVFTETERRFALSIAEVCVQALVRARLYEAEQQARQDAEQANRLKTQFMGMISHELRTPLTSIKGFISTLVSTDIVVPPEQQRQFLLIAESETDKLTELVEQLLNLVRLQAGTLPIAPTVNTVKRIIELATVQLKSLTAHHQLEINGAETAIPVMVDAARIAQVLTNLVGNAAKFSPLGSMITVNVHQEGSYVQIDVTDEGTGIPAEAREYVFEAFRQVQRQGATFSKGAGLGLAICKGLIEAHGGKIWIQDSERMGTTISFTLMKAS